ncbi:MAG: MBL fold metallo-hydrolase [Promethearchaeota archaeon]|nr:MAG: MBL fold metallo-hydrolase [Candidatus Lokiarchaeota archaeon]
MVCGLSAMFDFRSLKKEALRKPSVVDHDSFFLCRPGRNYKVNAAVSLIKARTPVLYDVGIGRDMISMINMALNRMEKRPPDVGYAIISHVHFDHCLNLIHFNRAFPNCKVILHENAFKSLMCKINQFPTEFDKNTSRIATKFWKRIIQAAYLKKRKVYVYKEDSIFELPDLKLKLIYTPGHSLGHTCLLDCTNKVLFLGDHLPFTPWLDISENSIDNMIYSLKKLLALSTNQVQYSVRNHGNLKDGWKEVYPWEEERNRFKSFLMLIQESLNKIPEILKNKPLNVHQIANLILKNKDYRNYNPIMNLFFMPPNLSWIYCYLLKLTKEKKIQYLRASKQWITV